jgi:hypothetical protein
MDLLRWAHTAYLVLLAVVVSSAVWAARKP